MGQFGVYDLRVGPDDSAPDETQCTFVTLKEPVDIYMCKLYCAEECIHLLGHENYSD